MWGSIPQDFYENMLLVGKCFCSGSLLCCLQKVNCSELSDGCAPRILFHFHHPVWRIRPFSLCLPYSASVSKSQNFALARFKTMTQEIQAGLTFASQDEVSNSKRAFLIIYSVLDERRELTALKVVKELTTTME